MKTTLPQLALTFLFVVASAACTLADGPAKWIQVEGLVNPEASFMISVDVDKPNRTYQEGDLMTVRVKAEKECYVYLVYYSGETATVLFPNQHQKQNKIPAQTVVSIPDEDAPFRFRTTGPFGKEVLHVIASEKELSSIPKPEGNVAFKSLEANNLRAMTVEVNQKDKKSWSEARIDVTTFPKDTAPPKTGRRVAVCIGISDYVHDRVTDLQVSHLDAMKMADAFKEKCNMDEVVLLTNDQATRANIEQAIFHQLVDSTRPGDSVFIFFSGHGGRTSDQNGDEADGFDEYLVPHDGILGKPETMILDDTFARWMQELSGREVAIIMDNCYSGGASKAIDGAAVAPKAIGKANHKAVAYDGIEVELKRSKDLGQQNTVVVAACMANQLAWEMPASQKGSVLTHYLIESLDDKSSDTNQDGKLTMQESYTFVKQKVEQYVKEKFDTEQNPVIVDNAGDGIIFQQRQ